MEQLDSARNTAYWGVRPLGRGSWHAAIYAPGRDRLWIELDGRRHALEKDARGVHSARIEAEAGATYRFCDVSECWPDPAARAQAGDVHAPSRLVDPDAFDWSDDGWRGRPWHEAVIYELHVGTFTEAGTFAAAAERLSDLAALGITAVELMPVAQFAGDRGWGYDGVLPYAPHPAYGTPDDLRAFVAQAHRQGLLVYMDVVYNHFGPEGAYISGIAPELFDPDRHTPWGAGLNYADPAMRAFVRDNVIMWLTEYRMDGLRLDAVHQIMDQSEAHLLEDIAAEIRATDFGRPIHLITEDERNIPDLREAGYDATWNDDFHHAVHCALTGESFGYYAAFAEDPVGDLALALERGHIEEGQPRPAGKERRGAPSAHLGPLGFVNSVQTHDQVGNRAQGDRLLTLAPEEGVRVALALLLLSPFVPMLFMGEEVGETAPFQFFAGFGGELGQAVQKGRAEEFAHSEAFAGDDVPDPIAPETFRASRPFQGDPARQEEWRGFVRKLLELRRDVVVPLLASGVWTGRQARRTGPRAIAAEWRFPAGGYGIDLSLGDATGAAEGAGAVLYRIGTLGNDAFALTLRRL